MKFGQSLSSNPRGGLDEQEQERRVSVRGVKLLPQTIFVELYMTNRLVR